MCGIFCALTKQKLTERAQRLRHRGPDNYHEYQDKSCFMGFSRLCIHDLSEHGNQPMQYKDMVLVCNGEIYNYKELIQKYNLKPQTDSDCEVILLLMDLCGDIYQVLSKLEGVFAFCLKVKDQFYVARDRFGVRPLFYAQNNEGYYFASEMKALHEIGPVQWMPPGRVFNTTTQEFNPFFVCQAYNVTKPKEALTRAINKRLTGDRKVGFLLSGGLDSSIVSAVGNKTLGKIDTFSINYTHNSRDKPFSDLMAKHLDSNHHSVTYTFEEGINILEEVIKMIESYDITTVRASVPHYLIGKYIKENTDIKIVLSGEGADEVCGGYLYLHKAPNQSLYREECSNLLDDIYRYDALRSDRCLASHGLEVRVPFLDPTFVNLYKRLDSDFQVKPEKTTLRQMFEDILPNQVCWRTKDGFSDSNGSFVKDLQAYIDIIISDEELADQPYFENPPLTKEALFYRRIFEKYYPDQGHLIPKMWLPKWVETTDPSGELLMN